MKLPVADVRRLTLHDGPGTRTTVFVKGCPLRCLWCHNPESLSAAPVLLFHDNLCSGCGRRCGPDENFCKICGSERPRLPALRRCPDCGESLPPEATFCTACGADLRLPREATSFPRPDGGET